MNVPNWNDPLVSPPAIVETTEDRERRFFSCMKGMADKVIEAADLLVSLEAEGRSYADKFDVNFLRFLRKVAAKQILPGVVQMFQQTPRLISRIGNLPIDEQQKIVDRKPIQLVVRVGERNQEYSVVDVDIATLRTEQIEQIFARDHLRSEREQRAMLENKRAKEIKKEEEVLVRIEVDLEQALADIVGRSARKNKRSTSEEIKSILTRVLSA